MTYLNVAAGAPILASTINDLIMYGPGRPMCKMTQATAQTLTSGTSTIIAFATTSEDYDDRNWHDVVTNPSRVTPDVAGRYRVTLKGRWAASTVQLIGNVFFSKNGTEIERSGNVKPSTASNTNAYGGELIGWVDMNGTTDYLEMGMQHTTTGAVTLNTNQPTFIVELERAP